MTQAIRMSKEECESLRDHSVTVLRTIQALKREIGAEFGWDPLAMDPMTEAIEGLAKAVGYLDVVADHYDDWQRTAEVLARFNDWRLGYFNGRFNG